MPTIHYLRTQIVDLCGRLTEEMVRRDELVGTDEGSEGTSVIDYQRLYEYRFQNVDQGRRERVWEAIAPVIWERLGQPGRLLDPAAGRCEFINAAPAAERWDWTPSNTKRRHCAREPG